MSDQQRTLIPDLHTPEQTAKRLGFKVGTLRIWRSTGEGPPFLKVGNSVRYDPAAVDAWILEQTAQDQAERAKRRDVPRDTSGKPAGQFREKHRKSLS